ncbi:MAG: S24 family peptidase [Phormidesmis sp. CAN_BIN44]|nr:S24 family peptidase [Phormidesmis sp. CAN_BIN44]
MKHSEGSNLGRPPKWGDLQILRPRLPLALVTQIDSIRDEFTDPEEAHQYLLDCLSLQPRMQRLKLFDSSIAATPGLTSGENDSYEERDVPLVLLKHPEKSFLLQVRGDSMEDAKIHDGDIIVVESLNPVYERPSNGSIVTVTVNDQTMIKRYRYHHREHELRSENRRKAYPPIHISSTMSDHLSVYIFGTFKRVIRESMLGIPSR